MPLVETRISCNEPVQLLAKFGTKAEAWKIELDDTPVFFKGAFYLGHRGDVQFSARNISGMDLVFMIEPKGSGTLYLALPKSTISFPVKGKTVSTPYDKIAIIVGKPAFRQETVKSDFRNLFKR